jgi:hypothetical protein
MRFRKIDALMMIGVLAASMTTRLVLERVWEETTARPAPKNPASPGVTWGEALVWGATAGLLAGLARTVARRGVSEFDARNG